MKIIGQCKQCGKCCRFHYWMWIGKLTEEYREHLERFDAEIRIVPSIRQALIKIPSSYCKYLDVETNKCTIQDANKPEICRDYPYTFNPYVFDEVREPDCGYVVVHEGEENE